MSQQQQGENTDSVITTLPDRYKMFVTNRPDSEAVGFELNYVTENG